MEPSLTPHVTSENHFRAQGKLSQTAACFRDETEAGAVVGRRSRCGEQRSVGAGPPSSDHTAPAPAWWEKLLPLDDA